MTLISPFVCFQYNEELHYVEPCLNGTLVQADVTNKDVRLSLVVAHCFLLFESVGRDCQILQRKYLVRSYVLKVLYEYKITLQSVF